MVLAALIAADTVVMAETVAKTPLTVDALVNCLVRHAAFHKEMILVTPVVAQMIDKAPPIERSQQVMDRASLKQRLVEAQTCFFVEWANSGNYGSLWTVVGDPHNDLRVSAGQGKGLEQNYSIAASEVASMEELGSLSSEMIFTPSHIPVGLHSHSSNLYCGPHLDLDRPVKMRLKYSQKEKRLSWSHGLNNTSTCR